ncbi:MAG: hypothetical protein ACI87O_002231, partial [Planctomycetota bacterium]
MACCASRERGNRASARLSMSARFAIPRSTTWYPLGREVTGNFLARVCCLAEEIQFGWRATSTAYVIRDGVELHTCLINTPHSPLHAWSIRPSFFLSTELQFPPFSNSNMQLLTKVLSVVVLS